MALFLAARAVLAASAESEGHGDAPLVECHNTCPSDHVCVKDDAAGADCRLNYYAAGVLHPNACAHEGKWLNSCDVYGAAEGGSDLHPKIRQVGGWSEECDPYGCYNDKGGWTGNECEKHDKNPIKWTGKIGRSDGKWVKGDETMADWTSEDANGGPAWVCPEEERSPSGCGDFRTDTRGLTCATKKTFDYDKGNCADTYDGNMDRRVVRLPEPLLPQKHTCVQRPIFYEDGNTDAEGRVLPRALGKHRPRWAAWGEYSFLPPQRWMHNAEHGTLVFLYHQCLSEADLCKMRRFIKKLAKKGVIPGVDPETAPLRFIMTPFKDLMVEMAIMTWGEMYMSRCFNEEAMLQFAIDNYRKGWEDWWPDGVYKHLLEHPRGEKFEEFTEETCGADPTVGKECTHDDDCGVACKCIGGPDRRDLLFAKSASGSACAC